MPICVRSVRSRRAAIIEPAVHASEAVTSGIEAQKTDQPTPDCRSSGRNASMPRKVNPFARASTQTARPQGVRGTTGRSERHSETRNATNAGMASHGRVSSASTVRPISAGPISANGVSVAAGGRRPRSPR